MTTDANKNLDRPAATLVHNNSTCYSLFKFVWAPGCLISFLIYGGLIFLFRIYEHILSDPKYTLVSDNGSTIISFDNNDEFKLLSMVTSAIFATSAIRTLFNLFLANTSQRPVFVCVFVIQSCAAFTHYLLSKGAMPVFDSCFGRTTHSCRLAEWISMVFLVMVLMNALNMVSWREFLRTVVCQTLAISLGCLSMFSCQLQWGYQTVTKSKGKSSCEWTYPDNSRWTWIPSPHKVIALSLLLISCAFYADIFRALRVRRQQRNSGIAACEQAEQAVRTIELSILGWTAIVFAYFLGTLNLSWFENRREQYFYTACDLCVKFGYSYLLSDAHNNLMTQQESHRLEMALKEDHIKKQRAFLRYVFHELRLPLNAILLGLEALNQVEEPRNFSDSESQGIIECLSESSVVMRVVLNDIQTFQQIEEGLFESRHEVISLEETIKCAVETFRVIALAKGIQFELQICSELPGKVEGDKDRIIQILENLISNAIKFNRSDESIVEIRVHVLEWHVGAERHRHKPRGFSAALSAAVTIEFTVVDHGSGITREEQESMFEAFSRIRAGDFHSGGISRGSGLGLVISKHIIQKMGGEIGFDSHVGVGSTFFFSVPFRVLSQEHTPSPSQVHDAAESSLQDNYSKEKMNECNVAKDTSETAEPQTPSKDVLIVDDVTSIRKMLGKCISGLGFQVHQAADGAEAVDKCSLKSFPLVLMDNIMPKLHGVDACREIRAHEEAIRSEKAFIVGMTGNTLPDDMAEFMDCGCDVVMTKPINWSAFKEVLKSHDLIPEQ